METDVLEKRERYENLLRQMRALIVDGIPPEGNISNLLAHLKTELNLFWVGLYMRTSENALGLGIFQGMPACTKIDFGKGVCGTAAQHQQTIVVENVHEFPGHIACDSASNSEIVVPLIKEGELLGVLDLDSPSLARFDEGDAEGLNELVKVFMGALDSGEPSSPN